MMRGIPEETAPGSGLDFQDVTSIFTQAGTEMEPGSFIFMDGFTLQDAMGAFEIGEPRLDSGLLTEESKPSQFDPVTPLLPEELCWILDKSFSYEMEWHSGNLLSHTVFTLLYTHVLTELDPDYVPPALSATFEPSRPPELVFLVLRAWVMGLLKSCDLSWRELSKGGVQDTEDWQGEKGDVSLLEGTPVKFVLSMLEDASTWVSSTTAFPVLWRDALRARIILRKAILELMQADIFSNPVEFQTLIDLARQQLAVIRSHPASQPAPTSPAHHAFDPRIARFLKSFIPLRVVPVPALAETWKAIGNLLDGWQEITSLAQARCLATWEIAGNLRLWLQNPSVRSPYLRSYTMSTFYDGLMILNKYSSSWMVDRFFFETLGVSYTTIIDAITRYWPFVESPVPRIEHSLYKLLTPHIRGLWLNPPRRKRHLANSLLEWHNLYDILTDVTHGLQQASLPKDSCINHLPKVALIWRLSIIREVIFSGFQLELLSKEERPLAYCYVLRVIEQHLTCLDDLTSVIPKDSSAYQEIYFQQRLLSALQAMSRGTFLACIPLLNFDWDRIRPSLFRRYKWAFKLEYDTIKTPVVGHPELHRLIPLCERALQDESLSPSGNIESASRILKELVESGNAGGWAGVWAADRIQFIRNLMNACTGLLGLPDSVKEIDKHTAKTIKWDVRVHPWFPFVDKTAIGETA